MKKNHLSIIMSIFTLTAISLIGYAVFAGNPDPNDVISIKNVNYNDNYTDGSGTVYLKGESFIGNANFSISFSGITELGNAKLCGETKTLTVINGLTVFDKNTSTCDFTTFKVGSIVDVDIKGDLNKNGNYNDSVDYRYTYSYQYNTYYSKTYYDSRNLAKEGFIDNGSMGNTGTILNSKLPF